MFLGLKRSVTANKANIFYYLISIALTLVILAVVTDFHHIYWNIPIYYTEGDILEGLMRIKGLVNGEWHPFSLIKSSRLAAPFGFVHGDFPIASHFIFVIFKTLSFFFTDYIVVYNVYIILTFVLTTVLFVFALRTLRVWFPVSIVFGLLFSFLPYHFNRLGHFMLMSYFLIPLMVVVLTWLWHEEPIFFEKKEDSGYCFRFLGYKSIFSIITLVLAGLSAKYYVFFYCFLALVSGVSAFVYYKNSFYHLISSFLTIVIICFSLFISLTPVFLYKISHGENQHVAHRSAEESENTALKLTHLLLPIKNHRVKSFAALKQRYSTLTKNAKVPNEPLGIIGLIGFLFLIFRFFLIGRKESVYDKYSILAISAVLLATVGGFSSLFALLISPSVRAYDRISIFIAAFVFFSLAFLLQEVGKRLNKVDFLLLLPAILFIGIYDQTSASMKFTQEFKDVFLTEKSFVHEIEKIVPENAMIFQLPYASFPEHKQILKMSNYSHLKGYLHSNTLRWSYGATRGRYEGEWYREMAQLPMDELIKKISIVGFAGIYIDRYGFKDFGKVLEHNLFGILRSSPIVSKNSRFAFFSFQAHKDNDLNKVSHEKLEEFQEDFTYTITPVWQGSCYRLETNKFGNWRWCGKRGKLILNNFRDEKKKVIIKMTLASGYPEKSKFVISSKLFYKEFNINEEGVVFSKEITIPRGKTVINLYSDAKKVITYKDPRRLVFRIVNFKLETEVALLKSKVITLESDRKKLPNEIKEIDIEKVTDEDKIKKMLDGWIIAWKKKDIVAFISFYSKKFTGRQMNLDQWKAYKKRTFKKFSAIKVSVESLKVTINNDRGEIQFIQNFSGDLYNDTGIKKLYLRQEGDDWKIVKETWTPR